MEHLGKVSEKPGSLKMSSQRQGGGGGQPWEQSVQGCGGGKELGTSGGGVDHGLTGAESEF